MVPPGSMCQEAEKAAEEKQKTFAASKAKVVASKVPIIGKSFTNHGPWFANHGKHSLAEAGVTLTLASLPPFMEESAATGSADEPAKKRSKH